MIVVYTVLQLFCIYNCIPESNRDCSVHSVAAVTVFTVCAKSNVISPVKYLLLLLLLLLLLILLILLLLFVKVVVVAGPSGRAV